MAKSKRSRTKSAAEYIKIVMILILAAAIALFSYRLLLNRAAINLIGGSIQDRYDVVVAGAGTGGIGAAIQAARMGSSVLLLEETDWVGGQMTAAGVTSIDVGDERWMSGIFSEFIAKVKAHYAKIGKEYHYAYWGGGISFEPAVGRDILLQMIAAEPKMQLLTQTKVITVGKSDNKITSVTLSSGQTIQTNNLVDATEYGDLLPLSGASYRLGNSLSTSPNLSACIQDITYLGFIKKYPAGVPTQLQISTPPPGYNDNVKKIFGAIMTKDGDNGSSPIKYPVSFSHHNVYRGVPDSGNTIVDKSGMVKIITKTGLNWANDYPVTSTLSVKYLTDPSYRTQTNCDAKLRTIQLLYYIQHEMGYTDWAVSQEGYDTPNNRSHSCANIPAEFKAIEYNLPPIPYVRESMRGLASTTLTAKDIKRSGAPAYSPTHSTRSIAVGDYGLDLHNCKTDAYLETNLETTADNPRRSGPFEIPLDILISKDVEGLIFAEKNISVSRLVSGAIRLQPITMQVGQASGALASLAASNHVPPNSITPLSVQKAVVSQNSLIYPFFDVPSNHLYSQDIQLAMARGTVSGYANLLFGPDDLLKRDQAATMIVKSFNLPMISPTQATFTDVQNNYWGYKWVESLAASGFTSGCATNPAKFCPNNNVTNTELAVFSLRGLAKTDPTTVPTSPPSPTYQDVASNFWGYKWVEGLAAKGIKYYCDSSNTKFCPNDVVTRAKATHILNQILNKLGR